MIAISTLVYDLDGHIIFNEASTTTYPVLRRRLSRTATLDGTATITDLGFSFSDSDYFIEIADIARVDRDKLEHIIKSHALVHLCAAEGCFIGAINIMNSRVSPMTFTFLIKEKVSA